MKKRVSVTNKSTIKTIEINSKKNLSVIVFMPIGVLILTFVGIIIISKLFLFQKYTIILGAILWIFVDLNLIYTILWNLFGKEIIQINNSTMKVKKIVFGMALTKEFDMNLIRNFSYSEEGNRRKMWDSSSRWGLIGKAIQFRYNGKTYGFGIQLKEDEIEDILKILSDCIAMKNLKTKKGLLTFKK